MVYISRVLAVGSMLSAALGQTRSLVSSDLADDNATEEEWAEDGLPPYDPIDEDVEEEDSSEVDEDFVDPFEDIDTPMTVGLKGGKMQVFTRQSGKGSDRLFTLDFGHVQELDANGNLVKGRSVKISKAAARQVAQLVTSQEVVGGAEALVARLSMPLAFSECGDSSDERRSATGKGAVSATGKGGASASATGKGASGKSQTGSDTDDNDTDSESDDDDSSFEPEDETGVSPARRLSTNETDDGLDGEIASEFSIEAFVFLADAALEYGDQVIDVSRGQLKFNILSSSWPFCGEGHSLLVDMGIHLEGRTQSAKHFGKLDDDDMLDTEVEATMSGKSGKAGGKEEGEASSNQGDKKRRTGKGGHGGKVLIADSGDTEVFVDMPTFALVDGSMSNCSVELDVKGGKLGIAFTFPAFNSTLLYDPTGGTTADLSTPDRTDDVSIVGSDDDELTSSHAAPAGGGVGAQHLLAGAILLVAMVA